MPDDVAIEKVMVLEALGAAVTRVRPGESLALPPSPAAMSFSDPRSRGHPKKTSNRLLTRLSSSLPPSPSVHRRPDPVRQPRSHPRSQFWTHRHHRSSWRPRRARTLLPHAISPPNHSGARRRVCRRDRWRGNGQEEARRPRRRGSGRQRSRWDGGGLEKWEGEERIVSGEERVADKDAANRC